MDKFHMIIAIATIIVEKVNEGQWDLCLTNEHRFLHSSNLGCITFFPEPQISFSSTHRALELNFPPRPITFQLLIFLFLF